MDRRLGWRWAAAATLVITLAARVAVADERRWDQLTPSPPPAGAIGGHASGCLAGAEPLPLDGLGYQVMRPSRNRYYAHPTTIEFVRARVSAEVPVHPIVAYGSVYKEILRVAAGLPADLIVMAAHRPQPGDFLIGSNAERVARRAPCSVLLVR